MTTLPEDGDGGINRHIPKFSLAQSPRQIQVTHSETLADVPSAQANALGRGREAPSILVNALWQGQSQ